MTLIVRKPRKPITVTPKSKRVRRRDWTQRIDLPELLREYRHATKTTQPEMAERLGMSMRLYNYIESGERKPHSERHVAKMARVLGIDPDLIWSYAERTPPDLMREIGYNYAKIATVRRALRQHHTNHR